MRLPMDSGAINKGKTVLVLLTAGAVWLAFFARQYSGKDWGDGLASGVMALFAVYAGSFTAWAGYLFISGHILRNVDSEHIEFDKALPIICATLIVLSVFRITGDARTHATYHRFVNASGETVECVSSEPLPDSYSDE